MLQEAKTVPEKDLRTQRFFGKRRSRRAGRAFCPAKRRHAKACSQQGSQKVSQNFLGKGATGIRAKSLLQCKLLRNLPPLQGSRKRFANAKIFWEKEEPPRKPCVLPCKTLARKGVLSTGLPKSIAELFGKRSNRHSSKEFAAMQTLADFAALRRGCGGRIRTCDLRVMSPTSYRTAPLRDIGTPSAEMLYNFIALPSVCQLFFTRQSKIFADAPRRGALSVLQK